MLDRRRVGARSGVERGGGLALALWRGGTLFWAGAINRTRSISSPRRAAILNGGDLTLALLGCEEVNARSIGRDQSGPYEAFEMLYIQRNEEIKNDW